MSQLTLLIGRKGSGKSTTFCEIAQYMKRRTLIIDPGQARAYTDAGIGFITTKEIPAFDGYEAKIKRISNVINKKQLVAQIFGFDLETNSISRSRAFLNGNLIMEDAASYVNSSMTEALRECVKAFKQYGLNLFLSYHSLDEISPDILRLSPDKAIFKKSGETEKVFSRIRKARSFSNYEGAMRAYYQAQYFGLTPEEIFQQSRRFLKGIAQDLYYEKPLATEKDQKAFCKFLSKFASGRVNPTKAQRSMANYQPFGVDLR
ncbi:MAG: ATP-binding protein [Bacteroidota bacterium]